MSIKNGIKQFKDIFKEKSFEEEVEFETSMLVFAFLSEIEKEADAQGMNRTELAKKVGTSKSYITQLFRGHKVPNLRILTAMGMALDKKFNVMAVECIEESRKVETMYHCNAEIDLSLTSMTDLELPPLNAMYTESNNTINQEYLISENPKVSYIKRHDHSTGNEKIDKYHGEICS